VGGPLPDGLDDLVAHNLISFKSYREPLSDWALKELTGHYVNYRKQVSPSLNDLLPTDRFQLYGVSTRFPQKLANQVQMEGIQPGVYEVVWGTHPIRVMVLNEIPEGEQNALWNLFSAVREKVVSAAAHYRQDASDLSSIINDLFENYQLEGLVMPYTMEDYQRDVARRYLDQMSMEERLKGLSIDDILRRFPADDILQRFSADEILQRFSADERLKGLSPAEIRTYLETLEKPQKP